MSFYYVATTLATIGYGDIIPTNAYEVMFSCVLIIMGSGIIY